MFVVSNSLKAFKDLFLLYTLEPFEKPVRNTDALSGSDYLILFSVHKIAFDHQLVPIYNHPMSMLLFHTIDPRLFDCIGGNGGNISHCIS